MKGLAALAVVAFCVVHPLEADADAIPIEVTIGTDCDNHVTNVPARVRKSNDDVLVWHFVNECTMPQFVFVCVSDATGNSHAAPWRPCKPFPKLPEARIGRQFRMEAASATSGPTTAHSLCGVDWPPPNPMGTFPPEKFCVQVVTGPETGGNLACPQVTADCKDSRGVSELALEVVP